MSGRVAQAHPNGNLERVLRIGLANLRINEVTIDARNKEPKPKPKPKPRTFKELITKVKQEEKFNLLYRNCASFTLDIFKGFATCSYWGIVPYAPTACRPIRGKADDGGGDEERARVVEIFKSGTPSNIKNFDDLRRLVEDASKNLFTLTAFILSTSPYYGDESSTLSQKSPTAFHAMVGLLFEPEPTQEEPFGVTFGAYPTTALSSVGCTSCLFDESTMVVVLGDSIASVTRERRPRQMDVKVRISGTEPKILEALLRVLGELGACWATRLTRPRAGGVPVRCALSSGA